MGWNDWYTYYHRVTQADMRRAADVLISTGMADHGYQYVNIDDCWMVKPGSDDPSSAANPATTTATFRPTPTSPT